MNPKVQIASITVGILFFFIILYFIRRRNLTPSHTVLWILLSVFLISIPLFQSFYVYISRSVIGFYTENLIYILMIGFLVIYVLYLTSKIGKLTDQVKELVSYTAILKSIIDDLKKSEK